MAFSIVPFLSIDAVGSELWTALHEYINGDTHKSVFDNSSPVSFPTASSTACCSRPFLTCGFEASSLACCLALALVLQREHIPDFPCASLSQLATPQREPPPCFPHRSVVPRARLPQPATSQRRRAFLCWDADDDDDDDIVQFVVSPGHLVLLGHFPSLRCWVPKGRTWFHRDRGPRVASVHTCVDVCSDPPRTFERGMNTAASLQARQRKNAYCCSFIYWWTVHVVTHPSLRCWVPTGRAHIMQSQQIEILFRIFIQFPIPILCVCAH